LRPFLEMPSIERVVVVISKEDHRFSSLEIAQHPKLSCVHGGHERYHSVLSGLQELAKNAHETDWVMVHDAARPNISLDDLKRLISTVGNHAVGGILGTPVSDSLKVVDQNNSVITEVAREQIWRAFTPQMFRLGLLQTALHQAIQEGEAITDEASAVRRMGHQPIMVSGRSDNIKVTTPADYLMMKKLMTPSATIDDPMHEEIEL
jgi:2-C-methyl-D-erythritol 4-phosphate cytidylyltransferase